MAVCLIGLGAWRVVCRWTCAGFLLFAASGCLPSYHQELRSPGAARISVGEFSYRVAVRADEAFVTPAGIEFAPDMSEMRKGAVKAAELVSGCEAGETFRPEPKLLIYNVELHCN